MRRHILVLALVVSLCLLLFSLSRMNNVEAIMTKEKYLLMDTYNPAISEATVSILPSEVIVENVGELAIMNVTIANVTDLFAYEVKLFYNSTQLVALWITLPVDHFLKPSSNENLYIAKNSTENAYNATHKFIWFAASLLAPENPRTGNGVLFQVVFNTTAEGGPYPLTISYPGSEPPYPVKLSSPTGLIACTSTSSYITVIPEFPSLMILPLFMTLTLLAVLAYRRKHTL